MFLLQRPSCRLRWRRVWLLSLLACLCCYALARFAPSAAEAYASAENRKFLRADGVEIQGGNDKLRLKLQRLPGSYKDRYEVLRTAIHRDQGRRGGLERRVLAGIDGNTPPNSGGQGNGSVTTNGLREATLNVISGSSVGSGEYFASVSIGTPPQQLFLIADTGSDLTWVKCLPTSIKPAFFPQRGDSPKNQSFDSATSSSFMPLSCLSSQCAAWFFPPTCDGLSRHCKFSYSYTDQSFSTGLLAFESVTLGERVQANVAMGCGQQYAGPNFDKAGGVIGLGQGPLSLASQLAAQSAYSNKFSYCLADFFGPSSISGSLAFGESLLQATLTYTPLIQNPYVETFYYVGVQVVKVGNVMLDIPKSVWEIDGQGNGGTIVDSGTTLAQFAKPAYNAIRNAFRQAIQGTPIDENSIAGLDLCYKTDTVSAGSLSIPELSIVFDGGLVLQPPKENYFTEAAPGITCLAMQEAPPTSFSVVGNLLQQNYHMEFDRLHNRLGVSPADCSKLHS